MNAMAARSRWVQVTAWFLAVSYGVGAPLTAILEYQSRTLSQRFDYPPWLIYLTCTVQAFSAVGVLVLSTRLPAATALTVITLAAILSHFRIGSPETAWAAVLYTVVQIWFGLRSRDSA